MSAQVVLNEIYTSPGGGKNEFFELYNSTPDNTPLSVDGFSVVTYFEEGSNKGFYVLDLPALTVAPRGFFVGSSAMPFSYQGTTNSTASQFSWNSPTLTASSGYLKKYINTTTNLSDGNASYDEAAIPANFNDLFYEKSNGGASFSIFIFRNGVLINSFYGGAGGNTSQPAFITSMPDLNVTSITSTGSTPFTIKFSSFTNNVAEFVTPSAGTDNGYIRTIDGMCNTWQKSSSSTNHTPGTTNGASSSGAGNVTVSGFITRGTLPATTSKITFDVTAGATTVFPVELQLYVDNGAVPGDIDALDTYFASLTQTSLADGYTTYSFSPSTANIIIIAKTAAGCFGQVKSITGGSNSTLPVKLISFAGNINNNTVQLNWTVDLNETAEKFVIERSVDGGKFIAVGSVNGTGTQGRQQYSFSDAVSGNDRCSYRLLMTDKDLKSEYSKIILFNIQGGGKAAVTLLQNPVQQKLDINFVSQSRQTVIVRVVDMTGSVRFTEKENAQDGTNIFNIPLSSSVTSGTYILSIQHAGGVFNQKFIKQ